MIQETLDMQNEPDNMIPTKLTLGGKMRVINLRPKSNVILFPKLRTPFLLVVRHWEFQGYELVNSGRGNLLLRRI